MKHLITLLAVGGICAIASAGDPVPARVTLNEIRIDQTGTDNDEYFEIRGDPDQSLVGLTYIVIGDNTAAQGSGVIESIVSLTGQTIPASGYFVVAESTFTLGTVNFTPAGANPLNFENSDNVTHMLVSGFTGTINQDLDTNNDGVLDITPWTAIVDVVAVILSPNPPTGTEFHYGPPTVGPDGIFVPGHVYRCSDTGQWAIGQFDPVGGNDTPGAANPVCVVELTGACCVKGNCVILTGFECQKSGGTYLGDDSRCTDESCAPACPNPSCPSDLNNSGSVDGLDVGILLADWSDPVGSPGCGGALPCCSDLNADGVVDGLDIGFLLGDWMGIEGGNPNCP